MSKGKNGRNKPNSGKTMQSNCCLALLLLFSLVMMRSNNVRLVFFYSSSFGLFSRVYRFVLGVPEVKGGEREEIVMVTGA